MDGMDMHSWSRGSRKPEKLRLTSAEYNCLDGVLIDSGASCNLIDCGTWNSLKEKHIRCESKAWRTISYGQRLDMWAHTVFIFV